MKETYEMSHNKMVQSSREERAGKKSKWKDCKQNKDIRLLFINPIKQE
jgi:hypothetical protein